MIEPIVQHFSLGRNAAGSILCTADSTDDDHRYQVNNRSPFRIRCCMPGCYHRPSQAAIVHWLATLTEDEVIEGQSLAAGMTLPRIGLNEKLDSGRGLG